MERTKQEWNAVTDSDPLDVDQLSLADAVTLLALIRPPTGETLARTIPLENWASSFAPTDDMQLESVRSLVDKNILKVHPDSPLDAFSWEDGKPTRFYLYRVSYYLTGSGDTAGRTRRAVDCVNGDLPGWSLAGGLEVVLVRVMARAGRR